MKFLLCLMLLASVQQTLGQQTKEPDLTLKDINGQTHRLSDYKGKVVLLNFWATWCGPCLAEMPDLFKYQQEYRKSGLQIIGVTHTSPVSQVRRIAKKLSFNYPVLLGTRWSSKQFGVGEVMPVTIIIDRDGKLRDRIEGFLTPEEFEQRVKPLLKDTN